MIKIIIKKAENYCTDYFKYFCIIFTLKTLKEYYISVHHKIIIDRYYIAQVVILSIIVWFGMKYYNKIMKEK